MSETKEICSACKTFESKGSDYKDFCSVCFLLLLEKMTVERIVLYLANGLWPED